MSGRSGSEALRSPSWADAAADVRAKVTATQQTRARMSSIYTSRLKPAPTVSRLKPARTYSTMVNCELENENGWKIVVRPNASFALTV